jgi:hypothetical protein
MPRTVCRITWRKGEPLGLAIYPSLSFLDLPREVRNQIYYEALVVSRPITVSSVTVDDPSYVQHTPETKQKTVSQKYTIEGRDSILDEITPSLLRCQSQVSSEATTTFYQLNTFYFDGNEVWNPLYTFLKDIGDSNRDHLRNLSIAMAEPYKKIYQDRYGSRISAYRSRVSLLNPVHSSAYPPSPRPAALFTRPRPMPPPPGHTQPYYSAFARLIPRDEFLSRPLQYIDPAIQACFRLLGSGRSGSPLTLVLVLRAGVPGVDVKLGLSVLPMALPNFIEGVRQEFARSVRVLWNCVGRRDAVIKQTSSIQAKGWEVVKARDGLIHVGVEPPSSILVTYLVLRRRAVDQIPLPVCENCYVRWAPDSS